jgi:U3 small nucleolar RNA-associated protein 14
LSPEEIKERTAKLAHAKRLKLYEEIKNKRIAKIKSKLYRKIKRKNKEREDKLLLQQLEQIDPEAAKERRLKQERERVAERVEMKHSTRGKYAKNLMRFAGMKDQEAKEGRKELIKRRDEIKMKRTEVEEESEEEISEESVSESEKSELNEESQESNEIEEESGEVKIDFSENTKKLNKKSKNKKEGLFALKFMKAASEREEERIKQQEKLMADINEDEEPNLEHIKAPVTKSVQYTIKELSKKIQTITEDNEEDKKYSGWTAKPNKKKKIEEFTLTTTNEALEEIEADIIQQKPLLGGELLEGLEEDLATRDIVHRAVAVSNVV